MSTGNLTRSNSDKMIAGVCGGLANYLGIDPVFVRLAFVLLLFASGIGFMLYLILWVIMPAEGTIEDEEIIQKNINEMGETISAGASRIGRPGTIGILLILLGVYFLFSQFGWFNWVSGPIFWSLLIIGAGVFLLLRRSR